PKKWSSRPCATPPPVQALRSLPRAFAFCNSARRSNPHDCNCLISCLAASRLRPTVSSGGNLSPQALLPRVVEIHLSLNVSAADSARRSTTSISVPQFQSNREVTMSSNIKIYRHRFGILGGALALAAIAAVVTGESLKAQGSGSDVFQIEEDWELV